MHISIKMSGIILGLCTSVLVSGELAQDMKAKHASYQQERKTLFAEKKALESQSHKQRMSILEEAEKCIQAAKSGDEYSACEKKEQEAREKYAEQSKAKNEELRLKSRELHDRIEKDKEAMKAQKEERGKK